MLIVFGQQYQTHSDVTINAEIKKRSPWLMVIIKHPLNNVFKSIQINFKNVDFLTLFSSLYIKVVK